MGLLARTTQAGETNVHCGNGATDVHFNAYIAAAAALCTPALAHGRLPKRPAAAPRRRRRHRDATEAVAGPTSRATVVSWDTRAISWDRGTRADAQRLMQRRHICMWYEQPRHRQQLRWGNERW
jgi:hypothetical protein